MDNGYRNDNLNVAQFGTFPSVNPSTKSKKEQEKNNIKEESALSIACAQGKMEDVKTLINEGWDINKKDPSNLSPIILAATNGHHRIVRLLVKLGAKISYDLLCMVKAKIDLLEEKAKTGTEDPYAVVKWKNFLDYLITEGKKQ